MLKSLKKFSFLVLLISLNLITSSMCVSGTGQKIIGSIALISFLFVDNPLSNGFVKKELLKQITIWQENIKSNKDEIFNFLINFFSTGIDGLLAINEIKKNKQDEEVLYMYLRIAANRLEISANHDMRYSKFVLSSAACLSLAVFLIDINRYRL